MMIVLLALAAHAETGCATDLTQDLNCNTVDASAELPVDSTDPICDGWGYPNADWYFDYYSYKCAYPVVSFDVDDDGFSQGELTVGNPEFPDVSAVLAC